MPLSYLHSLSVAINNNTNAPS